MLVVADTSPFIGLIKIELVEVLPRLYGSVVIPDEVAVELAAPKRPLAVREFIGRRPQWLSIRTPQAIESIPDIDPGEMAAISLARELGADILLIDDNAGRKAAQARQIRVAHTTALLLDHANLGIVADLKSAFDRLTATDFRVSSKILDVLLKKHQEFTRRRS